MRRLLVLAIPAAALPVTLIAPAQADELVCVEASTTPTACGSGVVGIAVCDPTDPYSPPATNIDPTATDGTATVSVNGGVAGVDAETTDFGTASPQGHVVVWGDGAHAGVGSTTAGVVDCP